MLGIILGPSHLVVDIDAERAGWRRGLRMRDGGHRWFDHEDRECRVVLITCQADFARLHGLPRGTVVWEHPRLMYKLMHEMPEGAYGEYAAVVSVRGYDTRPMPTEASKARPPGPWVVKVRRTGCRVGVWCCAFPQDLGEVKLVRQVGPITMTAPKGGRINTEMVRVWLDHAAGVAWVEKAGDLVGAPGFTLD